MGPLHHVLIVDSDEGAIQQYARAFRGRFEVTFVADSLAALEVLKGRDGIPVVLADYDSPYLPGPTLFAEIKPLYPNIVPVLSARENRCPEALEAVNQHNLFRLLVKPCSTNELTKALDDAISHHELLTAAERAVAEMASSLVRILGELLQKVRPSAHEKGVRLQELARLLRGHFPAENAWQFEATALLSQFGLLGVSDALNDKLECGAALSDDEQAELAAQPRIAAQLLAGIEVLGPVAENLKSLAAAADGRPRHGIQPAKGPDGARLVQVLIDYDELTMSGLGDTEVLTSMYNNATPYDEDMLSILEETLVSVGDGYSFRMLAIAALQEGMVVREGIRATNGNLVTGKNTTLTKSILVKVRNYAQFHTLAEPIAVLVPDRTLTL